MTKNIALIVLLLPLLAGAQSIKVNSSKSNPVGKYESFTVVKGDVVLVMERQLSDTVLERRLQEGLIGEMESRGYLWTSDTTAQLRVSFVANVLEKQEQSNVGPLGQQPADQPGQVDQSQTWTQVLNQSSLSIVITDSQTGKKIWESTAEAETASAEVEQVLLAALSRSLRKLPRHK